MPVTIAIDYTQLPTMLSEMIINFDLAVGCTPTAIYLGRLTIRHLKLATRDNIIDKVYERNDRDYFDSLPIYTVDCEHYMAVS